MSAPVRGPYKWEVAEVTRKRVRRRERPSDLRDGSETLGSHTKKKKGEGS